MTKEEMRRMFQQGLDKYKEATGKTDSEPVFHVAKWLDMGMFAEWPFDKAIKCDGTADEAAEYLCNNGFEYGGALSLLCFAMEPVLFDDCEDWSYMQLSGFSPNKSREVFAATVDDIKFDQGYNYDNDYNYHDIQDYDLFDEKRLLWSDKIDFDYWYDGIDLV